MEISGIAAMVSLTQNRTMMAMKEARAAASLADIAKEKLDDVEGRLDGALQLHVALSSAQPGENPRPIVRGLMAHLAHQLSGAEDHLEQAKQDLAAAEESHARLQRCLGKVRFLKSVASRLCFETRTALHRERKTLLGGVFGSKATYDKLKVVNAARRGVAAAVAQGEAMAQLEAEITKELTSQGLFTLVESRRHPREQGPADRLGARAAPGRGHELRRPRPGGLSRLHVVHCQRRGARRVRIPHV